jgi:hypothetical protein
MQTSGQRTILRMFPSEPNQLGMSIQPLEMVVSVSIAPVPASGYGRHVTIESLDILLDTALGGAEASFLLSEVEVA